MTVVPSVDDLHAWADGRLDAEGNAAVAEWLAANPDEAQRWYAYRDDAEALRRAFAPVMAEAVPERLGVAAIRRSRHPPWPRQAVAAALLLAVGAAGGWFAHGPGEGPATVAQATLSADAVAAHRIFAAEVRHPVEVPADQEAHLVGWLSKRLEHPIKVPHLAPYGFRLMGGRLLPSEAGPAAQFMYEDAGGRRLTLYVRGDPGEGDTAFRFVDDKGLSAFYWIDRGMGFVMIGDVDRPVLTEAAHAAYRALSP